MGRINVLDKHLAELIAAGEVVERPSSAIKELIENSIDSGATAITVEIQNGGVTMLRVTDNGSGIMRDDIRNAFLRHATSKIGKQSDLDAISTLGFRGEALASISAVAKVELLTKAREEDVGTHYIIEGGVEKCFEDAGCPDGTTFIVRELFYNTPARMKYLKSNTTESSAVAAVVDKTALSHSEVAFTFIRDNRQTLKTAGDGNGKNCVYSVLGRDFSNNSVFVDYTLGGIRVEGYVTKPQAARGSRGMQNFFINGRFVRTRTAMAALEEACKGMVMVGKYPGCVLHITIPPELVDVNVHPAKIEVRFANDRPIFEAVYHGVRSALYRGDTVKEFKTAELIDKTVVKKPFQMSRFEAERLSKTPNIVTPSQKDKASINVYNDLLKELASDPRAALSAELNDPGAHIVPSVKKPRTSFGSNVSIDIDIDEESALGLPAVEKKDESEKAAPAQEIKQPSPTPSTAEETEKKEESLCEESDAPELFELPQPVDTKQAESDDTDDTDDTDEIKPLVDMSGDRVRFVGEAFKTYIIIEKNDELVLIDKHALHERIIYEKLKREQGKKHAQFLLEPQVVRLSKAQYSGILEKRELMDESGFEIEDFGNGAVLVRTAPSFIDAFDVASTVEEMAEHILESKNDIESEYTDWLYHNIACRSAIKGGDKSSPQELVDLYIKMGEDPNYRYCPHGRPTSIALTRYRIEKQFGRLG